MSGILARLRDEPALVRTVVYGLLGLWGASEGVIEISVALVALAGIEIRNRVTPVSTED